MRLLRVALGLAGLGVVVGLIAHHGAEDVAEAFSRAGAGLFVFIGYHAFPLALDVLGWGPLIPPCLRPPLRTLTFARWIGESVNGLLPVAQVGGDLVRARLVSRAGVPAPVALGSVVTDLGLGLVAQIAVTVAGVTLLLERRGWAGETEQLVVALLVLAGLGATFFLAQSRGVFLLLVRIGARFARRFERAELSVRAALVDAAIRDAYARRRDLAAATALRGAGQIANALEVAVGLWLLGHPIGAVDAVVFGQIVALMRAVGFAVPVALGVQEGAFVLAGDLLGVPVELALALALMRRAREVTLGLPGLAAWARAERRVPPAKEEPRS